jgi:hypothetical protein
MLFLAYVSFRTIHYYKLIFKEKRKDFLSEFYFKMALTELVGCLLLAFGPPLALFVLTVAKDPIRVIVLITR